MKTITCPLERLSKLITGFDGPVSGTTAPFNISTYARHTDRPALFIICIYFLVFIFMYTSNYFPKNLQRAANVREKHKR